MLYIRTSVWIRHLDFRPEVFATALVNECNNHLDKLATARNDVEACCPPLFFVTLLHCIVVKPNSNIGGRRRSLVEEVMKSCNLQLRSW